MSLENKRLVSFYLSFQVSITPVPGKRIEHMGVKIELLGQIGMLSQLLLVLQHVNYVTMVLLLEIP